MNPKKSEIFICSRCKKAFSTGREAKDCHPISIKKGEKYAKTGIITLTEYECTADGCNKIYQNFESALKCCKEKS